MVILSLIKLYVKYRNLLLFLRRQLIDTVLVIFVAIVFVFFVAIVFVFFVDKITIAIIISSHSITEVSAIFFKNFLFSQIHLLGFQL